MSVSTIDSNGRLSLPAPVGRRFSGRTVELVSHSESHMLFASREGGVDLAGVVGDVSIAELLSFINMYRKGGVLRFDLPGGSKTLYFQKGEIVFASSTFPHEDLGEILLGMGKVERADLQKARQLAAAGALSLGRVLVDREFVNARDLWLATRSQVENLVYSLFSFAEGGFSYRGADLEEEDIVCLSLSTQNLIMEGLRRLDERGLFLRRIGSLAAIPVLKASPEGELDGDQRRLLELLSEGRHDVRELVRRHGGGEFTVLRLLYQLLEQGVVALEDPPVAKVEGPLGEVFTIFNGALVALAARVQPVCPDFSQRVSAFLRELPHPYADVFRDVALCPDGGLEGPRLLANLAGLEEQEKKKLLADALGELMYMECMMAREALGATASAVLIQKVQEISQRVKNLIGRKE